MPAGRPSDIDKTIAWRDIKDEHGNTTSREPITVADRITQGLRVGGELTHVAKAAGVTRETVNEWLRVAAKAELRLANDPNTQLTDHERRCIEFSASSRRAIEEWHLEKLTALERIERGDLPVEVVTEKYNEQGELLERSVRRERTLPDVRAIHWRLSRRFPDLYSERVEVAGQVDVALTEQDRVDALTESLRAFQRERRQRRRADRRARADSNGGS